MTPTTEAKTITDSLLDRILTEGAPSPDGLSSRIVAAAVQQIEDFGIRRFTIDDVARRAGISRVTIYRYFPKRDRLIEAALFSEFHSFLEDLKAAIEPCSTLEEQLVEGFVAALAAIRSRPLFNRLLRTEPELILPLLTVQAGPVLAAGREFIARFARDEAERAGLSLSEAQIEGQSELLARIVLSFTLTPDSIFDLTTLADTRRFAERYLTPSLGALSLGAPKEEPCEKSR
jgi:AcrR family transcriptional regulator